MVLNISVTFTKVAHKTFVPIPKFQVKSKRKSSQNKRVVHMRELPTVKTQNEGSKNWGPLETRVSPPALLIQSSYTFAAINVVQIEQAMEWKSQTPSPCFSSVSQTIHGDQISSERDWNTIGTFPFGWTSQSKRLNQPHLLWWESGSVFWQEQPSNAKTKSKQMRFVSMKEERHPSPHVIRWYCHVTM